MQKNEMKSVRLAGEADSADEPRAHEFVEDLDTLITEKAYRDDQVFNVDETSSVEENSLTFVRIQTRQSHAWLEIEERKVDSSARR